MFCPSGPLKKGAADFMKSDPTPNDPNDPLISILVYNYDTAYLKECLESIFTRQLHKNLLEMEL